MIINFKKTGLGALHATIAFGGSDDYPTNIINVKIGEDVSGPGIA